MAGDLMARLQRLVEAHQAELASRLVEIQAGRGLPSPLPALGSELTDGARRVLQWAESLAELVGGCDVREEHLALGLLADRAGRVRAVLEGAGLTEDRLRERLAAPPPRREPGQWTEGAWRVVRGALDEARARGDPRVRTAHLLLAVLAAPALAPELQAAGVSLAQARAAAEDLLVGSDD